MLCSGVGVIGSLIFIIFKMFIGGLKMIEKELKCLRELAVQLDEEDSLIRMVLDTSPIQIWAFDGENFLYFSKEWYRYTGAEHKIGKVPLCCFMDAIHEEDRATVKLSIQKVFAAKTKINMNIRLRGYDGEYRIFKSYAAPYFIDGVLHSYHGYNIDITKQKEAEKKLMESNHMLRGMCDNLPEMIWCKDLNEKYLFANKAVCEQLLFTTIEEVVGKDDKFFAARQQKIEPDNDKFHTFGILCYKSDQHVLTTRTSIHLEEVGYLKGKKVILDITKSPFFDNGNDIIGVVGSGRNVTKQRLYEKEIKEKEKQG